MFQLANLAGSWCLATILRSLCGILELASDLLPMYQDFIAHLVEGCTCIMSILGLDPNLALKCIFLQANLAIGFNCSHTTKIISSISQIGVSRIITLGMHFYPKFMNYLLLVFKKETKRIEYIRDKNPCTLHVFLKL